MIDLSVAGVPMGSRDKVRQRARIHHLRRAQHAENFGVKRLPTGITGDGTEVGM